MALKPETASAILSIDLNAFESNFRMVQSLAPTSEVAGVIKANGYGLGMKEVFQALKKWSCQTFFISTLEEGLALRALDSTCEIMTLNGLFHNAEYEHIAQKITPVIGSVDTLERWAACAKELGQPLPAVLHFDTGMNRLGFDSAETRGVLSKVEEIHEALDIRYVMSHFACADEAGHGLNAQQTARFESIAAHFPDTPKSLCNSSGIFRYPDHHYDLVRPGYCLYGGNPTPEAPNPMSPVVHLKTRVLQLRTAAKGETTGYGASRAFDHDTLLATVSLGYADGFLRSGSNTAKLYWQGQPCPVVGRISMDLVTVDLSSLTTPPVPGDWLEVLGENQSVDTLALACGTIGYEILTSLGERYTRDYQT